MSCLSLNTSVSSVRFSTVPNLRCCVYCTSWSSLVTMATRLISKASKNLCWIFWMAKMICLLSPRRRGVRKRVRTYLLSFLHAAILKDLSMKTKRGGKLLLPKLTRWLTCCWLSLGCFAYASAPVRKVLDCICMYNQRNPSNRRRGVEYKP